MKNFTSHLRRLVTVSLVIFATSYNLYALQFDPWDWHKVSDNTTNGYAIIDVERYDGGTEIEHNLYLQANINGTWTTLWHYRHYMDNGNKYSQDYNIGYIQHIDMGQFDVDGDGENEYVTRLVIQQSPSGVYNSAVSFRWVEEGTQKDQFSLVFYKPNVPGNLTASQNLCNKIDLSWDAPDNIRAGTNVNYHIYRNDSYFASTPVSTTSYTYTTPVDGTAYNFKVRLVLDSNSGMITGNVQGSSKAVPVAPANISASNDQCNGTIEVKWDWTGVTPVNYQILRSTSLNGTYTVLSSTIPGSQYQYEDTPPLSKTTYYYKVQAKNDCGDWGSLSSGIGGSTPDVPGDPSNIVVSEGNGIIGISWTDNSTDEEKFVVTKTNLVTGVTNTYDVDKDSSFYNDDNAQLCIPYSYEVKAVNACGESNSIKSADAILSPDLSSTFSAGSLKASKGFYPDIVHLEWDNNNRNQISAYYIYRKVFESSDSILLTTLDGALASYDDNYAENGILYEYSIIAEGLCDTLSAWSNVASDIGFRNPAATVSGKVTYGNGSPVKGITVTAESDDLLTTTSLTFNGTDSYLEIADKSSADIQNNFSFQAYIRMSEIKSSTIFTKGSQYKLNYTGSAFEFSVGTNVLSFPYAVPLDTYIHVSVSFDGSTSSFYLDGELKKTNQSVSAVTNNASPFILGKQTSSNYFKGYMDEIRIWKTALDTTTIKTDYNRYISYRNDGLIGYYRLNENINIDMFFDISKSSLSFNENHGVMYNSSYSTVVPEEQQLWFRGLTNQTGDYLITGIPYFTDGSSFNIVPMLAPHQFNPGSKTLYLSDESQVHNNIDFIDISSFQVNGSIIYRNTNFGVKGVTILVDGEMVFGPDSKPEVTDEQGRFEVLVPIGNHYISWQKDGHVFDAGGRYPYLESNPDSIIRHNFVKNLTFGNSFIDTTLVTVIGRVIGGTGFNETPMGFGQSANNIGKATITIDHSSSSDPSYYTQAPGLGQQTISYTVATDVDSITGDTVYQNMAYTTDNSDIETRIFTSSASGEFVARLIPERFTVVNIEVDDDANKEIDFGNRVIDLSTNPALKYEYLYDDNGVVLDSIQYHIKLNYVYQIQPEISVSKVGDPGIFYGEDIIVFNNPLTGTDENIVVSDHFKYPVFKTFVDYSPEISIFESYHNYETGQDTYLPVKEAEIKIINDLAIKDQTKTYQLTADMNGVLVDTFKVGIPNVTKSESDQTSFTKTMQINVTVGGSTFSWLPGNQLYRAYIIGQRPKGNNFYTEGPQVPEIILHDPPGSHSSAYIEKGSSYSVSSSFSTDFENGSGFGAEILLGVEVAAGGGLAGPVIKTDTKNSGSTGLSFSASIGESGEYVKTYQFSERVETSSEPGVVGSMGDIYIGKSYNYFYGETDNLKIVPYDLAQTNGIISLDPSELKDVQYTIGIVDGFVMNPDNSDTYFKYTQAHLLNKLLPELESRRNALFLTSRRSDNTLKYTSHIDNTDLRYGIAHTYEVVIIGPDTIVNGYYKMSDSDSILTYSFRPEKQTIEDLNHVLNDTIYENDSIRYFNDQIGIWIDAIRLNEAEKAMAIENSVLEQNISFDGAVGSISRKEVQTISYNKEETRTKNMHFGAQGSVGFTFNKAGIIATGELSISHSLGVSTGESFSQTMEYGYTLEDGDVGDYYSINVYRRMANGIYNATELEETKVSMPSGFDFGLLGGGVTLVGGAIAVAAASSYNAGGGIPIVAGATAMAVAAGLSYIPYVSFLDEVKEQGELFEPGNIRVSSFDISSPIFSTLGGQTMCPYQGLEHTFFYRNAQGDSVVFHKPTLQREKPEITAEPAEVFNIPVTDKAFFNLKLANNTESGDDQWYTINVVAKSNPNGAAVKIDGISANQTVLIPANESITKLLSIEPTNKSIMDYENIGIVIRSTCQYDPTDFMPEISDTVYISAHFQSACTNVEILEPLDNFVVNARDNDTLSVRLGGFNLEHETFTSFRFEYKPSSGSTWIPVKYFVNDPALVNKDEIQDTVDINNQSFVAFEWDMTSLKDREYDVRSVSVCSDGSENVSSVVSGILDGQRPQVFGTPQPADGILNVNENISVQFNEQIEGGLLSQFNFNVKGTLNNYKLKHEAYLHLNGTSDYASISQGISFNDKSFTIEFWMRTDTYDNSVIFSQGNDPSTSLEIGLSGTDKTYFKIGNMLYDAPFQFSAAVPSDAWQHMAYVYDYGNGDVFIYQNDKIILEVRSAIIAFNNTGKVYIGKSSVTGADYYEGSIHDLRIWSKYLNKGDVYANQYTALSGNEVGLYGYWPMDEAFGELAVDKAANRHMDIFAPWEVYPGGSAWNFAGSNFLQMYTGYFSVIPEMDYTMEFWFKANNPSDTVCLFSNQRGDGKEGNDLLDKTLSIYATSDGKIWVASKGNVFEAVSSDYFDNTWHHFALVVRRRGNAAAFIDGEPQHEKENSVLGGISGANMYLGVQKWSNISGAGEDKYFTGKLDEFRLWNLAKTTAQIRMDMNSKLQGDEIGLMVYHPFEGYYKDNAGVVSSQTTLENFVSDANALDAVPAIGNSFSSDAPNMKDVRPVQSIAYDYVASGDKIIINPKSYLFPEMEKNIIELTVQDVEDKYGNPMASPVTWTAYVHRNQVRWEDERRSFSKELYQPLSFVSSIKNTGGQQVGFSIINLPQWLTASPATGVINPESSMDITFTVNPALNIGDYNEDIVLRTENGYDEKLTLSIRVYKKPPSWHIDPSRFENTMNIVGKIKIGDVFSTDEFDMLAAFKKGTDSIRGVSNVRYIQEFDSYLVFLTVYGNVGDNKSPGDSLDFLIWDASSGQILDNVTPFNVVLLDNTVMGTTINPVVFESTGYTRHHIALKKGWNWVSFNKLSPHRSNLDDFFWALEPANKDIIKTHGGSYSQYSGSSGHWSSGIDTISYKRMYQINSSHIDTIVYSGTSVIPEDNPIQLVTGWNHVGYIPDLTMDVSDAMRNFVPAESDIIKSQSAFAMYDSRTGWLGTLDVMRPGEGYMLKANGGGSPLLTYPNTTLLKNDWITNIISPPSGWENDLNQYESTLSIVAQIETGDIQNIKINNLMVLGAFINDECHGFISPMKQAAIGYDPFFLNVNSNEQGQYIQFRLFDGTTGNTYSVEEIRPFVQDAVYGTIAKPLVLSLSGLLTGTGEFDNGSHLSCYPNPFNDEVNIKLSGNLNIKSIDILNTTGSVVKHIYSGTNHENFNQFVWKGTNDQGTEAASGLYYVRMVTENSVQTVKISKTK